MKYKLLSDKGIQFVCFEDGVKIPYQVSSMIKQHLKDPVLVIVEFILGDRLGVPSDKKMLFEGGRLCFGGKPLTGYTDLRFTTGDADPHCFITVECEIVDTIEKPKNANY